MIDEGKRARARLLHGAGDPKIVPIRLEERPAAVLAIEEHPEITSRKGRGRDGGSRPGEGWVLTGQGTPLTRSPAPRALGLSPWERESLRHFRRSAHRQALECGNALARRTEAVG